METPELINVNSLEIWRGSFDLRVPSWQVQPGQVVGVVGPNGAGKTTLLEALAGLSPSGREQIRVFGLDPWRSPAAVRSALGFMSDDMPLYGMRIGPMLRMISGYYTTWDGELVEQLLDRFEIDRSKDVDALSTGQGTRIRLITALAFRPRVLILDEPAAGLDLAGRRTLLETVLAVVADPERSVIVSSHQLRDVERIADRLLVLDRGRVVREGATNELIGEGRTLEEALLEWGASR